MINEKFELEQSKSLAVLNIYRYFALGAGGALLVSGLIYAILQIYFMGGIEDKLYISLSLGQNLFALFYVCIGLKFVLRYQEEIFYDPRPGFEKFRARVLRLKYEFIDFRKFWWLSLFLGIFMCYTRYTQGYWVDNNSLKIAHLVFLFFGNVITGYCVYLFVSFIFSAKNLWGLIDIELWVRDTKASRFIFNVSKRLAFIGAVYMSMNVTSALTSSKIEVDYMVYILLFVQILLLVGSIIIPSIPFMNKISRKKQEDYSKIEHQIQKEYSEIIKKIESNQEAIDFEKMNSLLEIKNQLDSVNSYPFRSKTIVASFSIVFISLLPIIFEYLIGFFTD